MMVKTKSECLTMSCHTVLLITRDSSDWSMNVKGAEVSMEWMEVFELRWYPNLSRT